MLNTYPLNTQPLNTVAIDEDVPVVIDPPSPPNPPLPPYSGEYQGFPVPAPPSGHSFRWTATVMLGGVNVTSMLTGAVRVDREEGAAGIADFNLFYPVGTAVITDLASRAVTIDYSTDSGSGVTQVRLFTGLVAEPRWDAVRRVMSITCTDNLQQRIESLSIAAINDLAEGFWTADIFEPIEGRSRWDYAQERMSSRQASLDVSADGALRVTNWQAKPVADYIFGAGTTAYESVSVGLAQLRNVTNRVEIELKYRYSRLMEGAALYRWDHPAGTFCNWLLLTTELPTKEMVFSATTGANLVPTTVNFKVLPPTQPDPCGYGSAWINNFDNLLLGASWTGTRRWAQSVTETYKLTLSTAVGLVADQQVIDRTNINISVENEASKDWPSSIVSVDPDAPKPAVPVDLLPGDLAEESRRFAAIRCALSVAQTSIYAAHRQTLVSWSVPTSMALNVDLSHTLEINDQSVRAIAKCSHRVDEFNFETGSAVTTLSVSVMRGGGVSDTLTVPPRQGASDPVGGGAGWNVLTTLPTQIGHAPGDTYDPDMDGFSGNGSIYASETYPRRMAITVPEVEEARTDEKTHEATTLYRVGIPNDVLEL